MPWEPIGECGTGRWPEERGRVIAELELGIAFLRCISCETDPDCIKLGIMYSECEVGDRITEYPQIGLWWNSDVMSLPPNHYVTACQNALLVLSEVLWDSNDIRQMRKLFVISSWHDGGCHFGEEFGIDDDNIDEEVERLMP